MHHLNHVHRRGAVYVWRRRLPVIQGKKGCFIQVSLRSARFSTAKSLTALLNCAFGNSMVWVKTQKITRAEAQQFLSAIVANELERIEAERYVEPDAKTPEEWRNRYLDERAQSEALRRFAMMGPAAQLFEEDRVQFLHEGRNASEIQRIEDQINNLLKTCHKDFTHKTQGFAETALERANFDAADLRALSRIRLTGQADALSLSDRRKQTTSFVGLVAAPREEVVERPLQAQPPIAKRTGYSENLRDLLDALIKDKFADTDDEAEQKKVVKARNQNRAVLTQFIAAVGQKSLSQLCQIDIHYYVSVLDQLPKTYGKSAADRALSLHELIERAEELPKENVGLSPNTVNRNLSILRNFLRFSRARGSRPAERLFIEDLQRKNDSDDRNTRLAFSTDDLKLIFKHPIWTGSQSAQRRNFPGNQLIKDGLYWGPMIAAASGARREEIMGLEVRDIIFNHPVPHILLRPNAIRRLKNASSNRGFPIHSRLLELGFREYVQQIAATGAVDLFPELRPINKTESFGNAFYKPWKSALDQQLLKDAERKTFHSFRHRVITMLRHNRDIDKAWVKDLVGHKHIDETDARYRDKTKLEYLKEVVEMIPVVF